MGTTIGYLKSKTTGSLHKPAGGEQTSHPKHEYQSICDDEDDEPRHSQQPRSPDELFLSPLDFGPSLSESVFSELNDSNASQRAGTADTGGGGGGAIPKNINSMKAAVSASLSR